MSGIGECCCYEDALGSGNFTLEYQNSFELVKKTAAGGAAATRSFFPAQVNAAQHDPSTTTARRARASSRSFANVFPSCVRCFASPRGLSRTARLHCRQLEDPRWQKSAAISLMLAPAYRRSKPHSAADQRAPPAAGLLEAKIERLESGRPLTGPEVEIMSRQVSPSPCRAYGILPGSGAHAVPCSTPQPICRLPEPALAIGVARDQAGEGVKIPRGELNHGRPNPITSVVQSARGR